MSEKIFEWQYSGEKILLRTRMHIAFFLWQKVPLLFLVAVTVILLISLGIALHRDALWIYILASGALIIGCIALLWFLYTQSRYTFTSRRCIYFVRNSLFHRHYNEIHLVDLRTAVPKKIGLFGLIFDYGTLILTDKDDKRIIYAGIAEHKYLSRYLGRIVDYIKIHGHTDNLSAYQPRKIRETKKSL